MTKFIYDDFTDSLIISKKKKDDKVKGSINISNIVIDLTKTGKVVVFEVTNFSDFLKKYTKRKFKEIEDATFIVNYSINDIVIWLHVRFKNKEEQKMPIYVSTETPQLATVA